LGADGFMGRSPTSNLGGTSPQPPLGLRLCPLVLGKFRCWWTANLQKSETCNIYPQSPYSLLLSFISSISACWRWGFLIQDSSSFSVSGRIPNPGQVDVFLLQFFPDIVYACMMMRLHPDLPLPPSASLSLHVSM